PRLCPGDPMVNPRRYALQFLFLAAAFVTPTSIAAAKPLPSLKFFAAPDYLIPKANSVATADFDHDGLPDLAVGSGTTEGISLLQTHTGAGHVTLGTPVNHVFAFDANHDGLPDLVATTIPAGGASAAGVIVLGRPDGGFGAPTQFALG